MTDFEPSNVLPEAACSRKSGLPLGGPSWAAPNGKTLAGSALPLVFIFVLNFVCLFFSFCGGGGV